MASLQEVEEQMKEVNKNIDEIEEKQNQLKVS